MEYARYVDILAGIAAGINVTLVGHPFDTVKLRLQTQPSPPNQVYKGLVDCVQQTVRKEGFSGLYRGMTAPLAGQAAFRTMLFSVNSAYSRHVSNHGSILPAFLGAPLPGLRMSYADFSLGGSLAWTASALIECPINVVASQMQVQAVRAATVPGFVAEFSSPLAYIAGAPSKYGARALYVGLLPHLIRNAVGGAAHFGLFEYCRRSYADSIGVHVKDIGLTANMVAGSIGGLAYWTFTYPVDVVKGAMQGDAMGANRRFKGTADAVAQLWAEGGAARFTRGFSACILRAAPANAVLLTTAFIVKEKGYAYIGVE
jgi:solute carrier family 25 carnitine/acylcarnitine transporter 20/29